MTHTYQITGELEYLGDWIRDVEIIVTSDVPVSAKAGRLFLGELYSNFHVTNVESKQID